MVTIDKTVPLPPRHIGKCPKFHIPFREMEVGDSVLVPHAAVSRPNICARVKDANRRMLGHWVTRREGDSTRVFRTEDFRPTNDLV